MLRRKWYPMLLRFL